MLPSFLLSLFYFCLLAQAGRKKKGKGTTSIVSTVVPSTLESLTLESSTLESSSLPPSTVITSPPSTTSDADPEFSDSPVDLFDHHDIIGNIVCQSKPRFEVLHRPDCILSAEQVHAPPNRGPGLDIPPTAGSSSFRFYGGRGDCEIYVIATYVVSVGRTGVPTLWQPTEIEWIQSWIHVRQRVDQIIGACVAEPGESEAELRRKHRGKGGASAILMDGVRLANRMLVNDRVGPNDVQPPAIQFEILVHDGQDLAILRDRARSQGLLRDRGL